MKAGEERGAEGSKKDRQMHAKETLEIPILTEKERDRKLGETEA